MTDTTTISDRHAPTLAWLETEFPGWEMSLDTTTSWSGHPRPLWVARQPGSHPQAELTAAKLHTRLSDYEQRQRWRRAPGAN